MSHDPDHDNGDHECDKCGASFNSEDELQDHMKEQHDMDD